MTDGPIIDQPILDSDIADFIDGEPSFHPILQIWREVLAPARAARSEQITPQWASRICMKYQEMRFADMPAFRDRYFDKIAELEGILHAVIEADDECLNPATAEDDARENADNYVTVLTQWQFAVLRWELDWDCEDPSAGPELAAISEVHTMFFGDMGLTSLLDQINFEFTDMHRDALALALQAYKESRESDGE